MESTTTSFLPAPIILPVGRKFNWKVLGIIVAACAVAFVAVLPYTLTLQAATLSTAKLPMPLPLLLVVQGIQNVVMFTVVGGLGYFLATRIGLGLPFFEGWFDGEPVWNKLPRIALLAAVIGVLVSGLIVALDAAVFGPALRQVLADAGKDVPAGLNPPAWQGFLASFYGGITEEVLLRLGILSLVAWLGRFIGRTPDNRPTLAVLWIANILAAILFGLGHLPATAAAGIPLAPVVIVRAVVLNGALGLFAGWLYWRYGLESAMISHFSGDIVLHVLLPLLSAAAF